MICFRQKGRPCLVMELKNLYIPIGLQKNRLALKAPDFAAKHLAEAELAMLRKTYGVT